MSFIRPIPKQLLIHSVVYYEFVEDDAWEDDFLQPVTINHVRVEPATFLNRTNNRESNMARHILFIDRVHSSSYPRMKEKSKVIFMGEDYEVQKVNPYYAIGPEPHHYEVELV